MGTNVAEPIKSDHPTTITCPSIAACRVRDCPKNGVSARHADRLVGEMESLMAEILDGMSPPMEVAVSPADDVQDRDLELEGSVGGHGNNG